MPQTEHLINRIFHIRNDNDFNEIALEIFQYQFKNNEIYNAFASQFYPNADVIKHYRDIPFLPIEFFKSHPVITEKFDPEVTFTSSGTTGSLTSKHLIKDVELYQNSFLKTFETFFGSPKDYVILALLPSYLERDGSSLVYMLEKLIKQSGNNESGFFLYDYKLINELLKKLKKQQKKVILFGVTYALLDVSEQYPLDYPELIIIETGGMKGRRKELVREDLHTLLKNAFGVKNICSEYGMTELLSQAYSKGEGIFTSPPWMKILIRDTNDPFSFLPDLRTGGINIIDLANIHSCSFIATQDLGRMHDNNQFEVLGRFDNSDVRGCNLMVV